MKSLQQMVNSVQRNGLQNNDERLQQASDGAKEFIDRLFDELKATYPAWGAAMKSAADIDNAKRTWVKAFMENGISQIAQVKIGLVHARKDARPFFPSVGEFIEWCKGAIDTDEAYDHLISRGKPRNPVEVKVWSDCAFNCRSIAEDKSRALFKKTYIKWHERNERGEMPIAGQKALPKHSAGKQSDHAISERIRLGLDKQRGKR